MPDLSRYDGRTPEPPYETPTTEDFQAEHIAALEARVAELEAPETGALHLLARIREALGDNGTRMQDELLAYCREMRDSAGALAALDEDYQAWRIATNRYRAALERIKCRLSITDVPKDKWVLDLHGEITALIHNALKP